MASDSSKFIIRPAPNTQPTITLTGNGNNFGFTSFTSGSNPVVIDGCNTPGGTSRDLTIHTSVADGDSNLLYIIRGTPELTFKNLNIRNRQTGSVGLPSAVYIEADNFGIYGDVAPNVIFENCEISSYGSAFSQAIISSVTSSVTSDVGVQAVFKDCDIVSSGRGVYIRHTKDLTFDGCRFDVSQLSGAVSAIGVLYTEISVPIIDNASLTFRDNYFSIRGPSPLPSSYPVF